MGLYNIISFFWVILLFFYSKYVLKQDIKKQDKILKIQILLVFLYNIAMLFVFTWKIPVELSTTSYFVVPIIVLFNIKFLKTWTVYTSILIGFVYFTGMIIMGQTLYGEFPPYSVYTSLYNHGALLSYAYITLHHQKFFKSERYIIWIGIVLSASWAIIVRPIVIFPSRIFIYEVLDGLFARHYFPNNLAISLPIYYVIFVLTLYFSSSMVHVLSKKIYKED